MAVNLHERDIRVEAERIGKEAGSHEAKIEATRNLISMKLGTLEQIAQAQNLPLEEVEKIASELKQK